MNQREIENAGSGVLTILLIAAIFIGLVFSGSSEEKELLRLEAEVLKLEIEKLKKEGVSK